MRDAQASYLRGNYRAAAKTLEPFAAQAEVQRMLGGLYVMLGRYAEAEAIYRQLVAAAEREHGRDHPVVAQDTSRLADVVMSQGRYADANVLLSRAYEILTARYGVDHVEVAECLTRLGELAHLQGRLDAAERRYWQAYQVQKYLYGETGSAVGRSLAGLGWVALARGRPEEARPLLARALAIAERPARTQGWGRLDERDLLSLHAAEREHYAVRGHIVTRTLDSEHPEYARRFDHLAELYLALGRTLDAGTALRRSITIRERAFGSGHPELTRSLRRLHLLAAVDRERWRAAFLLIASLPQLPVDDAFQAIQKALPTGSADGTAMTVSQARKLLSPGEAVVAAATDSDQVYMAIVRTERAAVHRVQRRDAERALAGELGGVKHVMLASDRAPPELPAGMKVTRLY